MDLSREYVDSLFSKLSYVGSVTFTGGEPSLVPEVIGYAIENRENVAVERRTFRPGQFGLNYRVAEDLPSGLNTGNFALHV